MRHVRRSFALAGAVVLMASASVLAQEASTPPGSAATVVPPGGDPLGVPYGEWADRWWEWALEIPAAESPMSTDNCQVNQSGDAFFLPNTFIGSTLESTCTIGPDQWIVANVGGVVWTNDDGETIEEMGPLVEGMRSDFTDVSATIDGVEVPDLDSYWVISPGTHLTFSEDNLFGYEPGTERDAVIGAWMIAIPPLDPGSHTIVLSDTAEDSSTEELDPATALFTANITVPPAE